MNVQSDCESLYINCIEEYKKKYSIDDEKVYELFHEYHILKMFSYSMNIYIK